MDRNTAGMRGKDDERKLFLGGLPRHCTERDIRQVFSEFGEIESINIKIDLFTGQSRGFCFVVFNEPSVVDKVLSAGEIMVLDKVIEARRITKTTQPGKVFVGGITSDISDEKLREHFQQYGKIVEIQWPFDKVKNQRRGYCFLSFETREIINEILKSPKQTVMGVELDVKKVKFNPETMWHPAYGRLVRGYTQYASPYPPAYGQIDYREDYGYDDYYGGEGMDPYYDGYTAAYDSYAPTHYSGPSYAPRGGRGGRSAGTYTRHAPY